MSLLQLNLKHTRTAEFQLVVPEVTRKAYNATLWEKRESKLEI